MNDKMTQQHDFRADIKKALHQAWVTNNPENFGQAMDFALEEIMKTKPLRIAERVQSGELKMEHDPTTDNYFDDGYFSGWNNCLKTMSAQLIKECEDGK